MSASLFRDLVHAHPDICDQLLALLASQIRMLANRVNEFTTLDPHLCRAAAVVSAGARQQIVRDHLASPGALGNRRSRQHAA
jgi:hypothetical protein